MVDAPKPAEDRFLYLVVKGLVVAIVVVGVFAIQAKTAAYFTERRLAAVQTEVAVMRQTLTLLSCATYYAAVRSGARRDPKIDAKCERGSA